VSSAPRWEAEQIQVATVACVVGARSWLRRRCSMCLLEKFRRIRAPGTRYAVLGGVVSFCDSIKGVVPYELHPSQSPG